MTNGSSPSQGEEGDESSALHPSPEKIKCKHCGKIILTSELKNHYLAVHWDQPRLGVYSCPNCGKNFKVHQKKSYEIHLAKLDTASKCKPICRHCGEEFESLDLLELHKKDQFAVPRKKCSTCDSQYAYRCAFEKHVRYGLCVKRSLSCEYCGKTFNTVEDVREHEEKVLEYDPNQKCPKCKKEFEYSCDYNRHCIQKPFPCEFCKRRYCTEELLENHVKRQLESKKIKKCSNCKKKFQHRCAYKHHKKSQKCTPDVAPFSCQYKCGVECSSKKNLLLHEKGHEISKKCPNCGMEVDRHYYTKHKKDCKLATTNFALGHVLDPKSSNISPSSTTDQPSPAQPQFECKICGCPDVFQSEKELTKHRQNVHRVCPDCNKIFQTKLTLEVHLELDHSSAEEETSSAGTISPKDVHEGKEAKTSKDVQPQSARKRQDPPTTTTTTPRSPATGDRKRSPTGEKRQQGPSITVAPAPTFTTSSAGNRVQLSDLSQQQSRQTRGTVIHSRQTSTVVVTISIPTISETRPTTTSTITVTLPTTIATDTVIRSGGRLAPISTSVGGTLEKDANQDIPYLQRTQPRTGPIPTATITRPIQCEECDDVEFNSKEELARHQEDIHKKDPRQLDTDEMIEYWKHWKPRQKPQGDMTSLQRTQPRTRPLPTATITRPQGESGAAEETSVGQTPEKDANDGKKRKRSEDDQQEARRRTLQEEIYICPICGTELGNIHEIFFHLQQLHDIQEHTKDMDNYIEEARRKGLEASNPQPGEQRQAPTTQGSYVLSIIKSGSAIGETGQPSSRKPRRRVSKKEADEIKKYFKSSKYECRFLDESSSREGKGVCGQTFWTQDDLKEHVETVHRESKAFGCQVCTERFLTIGDLRLHYSDDHFIQTVPKQLPFKCHNCGEFFEHQFQLNFHKTKCHKCEQCGAILKSKEELDKHIQDFHKKGGAEFPHSPDKSSSEKHLGSPRPSPGGEST